MRHVNADDATKSGRSGTEVSERLWYDVHERITAFVARRIDEPADVADIVQTVFLRVHQHAAQLDDEGRLLPWLFQITRNAIADYYRAPARRRELSSTDHETPLESDERREDASALADLANCLRPMVEQLPPAYRDAIIRSEFDGIAQTELAAQLGLTVSGMKSRVQRGRAMLRDLLLTCCTVSLSATGTVMDFERRTSSPCAKDGCGCSTPPLAVRRT